MEPNENQEESIKQESSIVLFVKVGIVVLSMLMIIGFGIKVFPSAITVSSTGSARDLPIYCVNTDEKKVALSFDVDRGNEETRSILAILERNNVKATFFITGEWVDQYPEDLKAIAAAGHDLGNHSENHKQMSKLTKEQCSDEIMKLHNKVKKSTNIKMNLFRVPYGYYNDALVGTARECGYYTIQWDVDSLDWKDYGVDSILKSTVENKHLGNGSIILMHNGAKYTPEALELVINGLQDQGYEIVPVSELIYTGRYTVDKTGRQSEK